jgi:hypothetical protein
VNFTVGLLFLLTTPLTPKDHSGGAGGSNPNKEANNAKRRRLDGGGKQPNSASSSSSSSSSQPTTDSDKQSRCTVCNRTPHPDGKCPFYGWHPFANKEKGVAFLSSAKGAECTSAHVKHHKYLDTDDVSGHPLTNVPASFVMPHAPKASGSSNSNPNKGPPSPGNLLDDLHIVALLSHLHSYLASTNSVNLTDQLVSCTISLSQAKGRSLLRSPTVKVLALLDSGSLAGNFISPDTLATLGVDNSHTHSVDRLSLPICSGFDNICTNISVISYTLLISFVYKKITQSLLIKSIKFFLFVLSFVSYLTHLSMYSSARKR